MLQTVASLLLCGCVLLVDAPVSNGEEDDIDCKAPVTQFDFNVCSVRDYEVADEALNAQWKITKKVMSEWDKELSDSLRGAEKALLAAQRAWISYRDMQCELERFHARGGSIEPKLETDCLARVTRARTEELKKMAEGLGS